MTKGRQERGGSCVYVCMRETQFAPLHQDDLALNESTITDRGTHLESYISLHAWLLEHHHHLWSVNVARKCFPGATHLNSELLCLYGDQADGQ